MFTFFSVYYSLLKLNYNYGMCVWGGEQWVNCLHKVAVSIPHFLNLTTASHMKQNTITNAKCYDVRCTDEDPNAEQYGG